MSRLKLSRPAVRPKMYGRALLSGPAGSGKTWSALSIASVLAQGEPILVIDTERESALTYADVFTFEHLPWREPYSPDELAETLAEIPAGRWAVVVIDSLSHFWRGSGGTLDVAGGKFTNWQTARPLQNRLIETILGVPTHLLLTARAKTEYLVEANGSKITPVGLSPIQSDDLMFEVNVAFDISIDHELVVIKSRTTAVPVGRLYPPGSERKAAADYAEWLAGGSPPASREDIDRILAAFAGVTDRDARTKVKQEFVRAFGQPLAIGAHDVPLAFGWLGERNLLGDVDVPPPPVADTPVADAAPPAPVTAPQEPVTAPPTEAPDDQEPTPPQPEPAGLVTILETLGEAASVADVLGALEPLSKAEIVGALVRRGLGTAGNRATLLSRLAESIIAERPFA